MKKTFATLIAAALAATTFSTATLTTTAPASAQSLTIQFGAGMPSFQIRNGYHYYRGHRGFPYPRPGYRLYNGYYFPPAAFIEREIRRELRDSRRDRNWERHVAYCYDQYRSYREYDNSFQPYRGPRQQCRSPYYG